MSIHVMNAAASASPRDGNVHQVHFGTFERNTLTWYVRDGLVIGCAPDPLSQWVGTRVNSRLTVGEPLRIMTNQGTYMSTELPVKRVVVLDDAAGAEIYREFKDYLLEQFGGEE